MFTVVVYYTINRYLSLLPAILHNFHTPYLLSAAHFSAVADFKSPPALLPFLNMINSVSLFPIQQFCSVQPYCSFISADVLIARQKTRVPSPSCYLSRDNSTHILCPVYTVTSNYCMSRERQVCPVCTLYNIYASMHNDTVQCTVLTDSSKVNASREQTESAPINIKQYMVI